MRALAILALLIPTAAHAELTGKGIRAGAVTFSLKDESPSDNATNSNAGFMAGAYLVFGLGSSVSFEPELALSEKRDFVEHCSPCMTLEDYELWYLELPVLVRVDLVSTDAFKLHLDAGPELVVSMGGRQIDQPLGIGRHMANIVPGNIGIVGGAGVAFAAGSGAITLDLRYQRWAADIVDNGGASITSTNQLGMTVGYVFP
jgi:hypothetical protein